MAKQDEYSDVDDLIIGGGGAPAVSWKFAKVGTEFKYTITDKPSKQTEKDDDGELKTWKDGNPVEQIVLPISTNLRNNELLSENAAEGRDPAEDNGDRRYYVKAWGTQLAALRAALKEAGVKTVAVGGSGTIKLASRKKNPDKPTYSPTNVIEFTYVPPKEELSVAAPEETDEDAQPGGVNTAAVEREVQIAKLKAAGLNDETIASMVAAGTI